MKIEDIATCSPEELREKEFKVLNHGFVRLIDVMGDDSSITQAARVSYGKGTKKASDDRGLIRYLLRNWHTTPFEMVEFKFHIKLPIFVARQWIRHRTANVNEYSGRYSVMENEFYLPDAKDIQFQSQTNKQGRDEGEIPPEMQERFIEISKKISESSFKDYQDMLDSGITRELARINLPLSLYTQWYWKIDLHNLFHFLRLRMDSHAQAEIRVYAEVMAEMVKKIVPIAWEAFEDFRRQSITLTLPEMKVIADYLQDFEPDLETMKNAGLSLRERREFKAKILQIKDKRE